MEYWFYMIMSKSSKSIDQEKEREKKENDVGQSGPGSLTEFRFLISPTPQYSNATWTNAHEKQKGQVLLKR